jgi:hypothetical protein
MAKTLAAAPCWPSDTPLQTLPLRPITAQHFKGLGAQLQTLARGQSAPGITKGWVHSCLFHKAHPPGAAKEAQPSAQP